MKQPTQEAINIADEITDRLVTMNADMLTAENEENYSQAALIQTTISLFIANSAQVLATLSGNEIKKITKGLTDNSNYIFKSMKANQNIL